MPLLAFTLAVALCCGGARLRGWRVAEIDDPRSPNRGQFSLGTLVLAMTVAAVFLGLARLMRADIFDWATALVVVLLAAIGTSFFLAIVRQRPAEAIAFTLAASGLACAWFGGSLAPTGGALLPGILVFNLLCLLASALVLRSAGVLLARGDDATTANVTADAPRRELAPR